MTHGVSFKDYSDSFSEITHTKTVVPPAALTKEDIVLRQASAEAKKKERLEKQFHQVGDIMRKVNGFIFLTCVCGLKLKVPPNYKGNKVTCPKCHKVLALSTK